MEKPKYIMIHHSAVSYNKNSDQFEANNRVHKGRWGLVSSLGYYLGYNYEIAKNGRIRQARKDGEKTVACYQGDMNSGQCIHICLDGNFDIEKPASTQVFALRDLLKKLVQQYQINKNNIIFHRDFASKSCPGKNMDINFIRSLVQTVEVGSSDKEKLIKLLGEVLELAKKL
ncbi:MAG: peptidoglycan recognition family protein [Patescibacteria group bacterium]|jgi:N-acetylmuramoyl-L-alanine amidase|nr:peptidoglycan recognition family protein [Patescibacteria group bacterium]